MSKIYLIKKLWIDQLENRDAYGFNLIGAVLNTEQATAIKDKAGFTIKSKYPWPLNYAYEFKGDSFPNVIIEEIEVLDV